MRREVIFAAILPMMVFLANGCATFDGLLERQADVDAFLAHVETRTAAVLDENTVFNLDRCVAVALENNLDVKAADIEARLAKLQKRVAFANFLPEITLDYNFMELNRAPTTQIFGSMSTTMQDRIVRETAVNAQMPIFAPATWFLYAIHQRGEEISEFVTDYTRQMIALQVTGLYFQCLATSEHQRILEARLQAAKVLAREVESYYNEGMVTEADLAQVTVLVMARENELERNARAGERCVAELLTAMGLLPTADIQLEAGQPIEPPEGGLEDWILEALLNNPRLAIEDRLVEIEKEKARIAVSNFLPMLAGFASRSHTSNSLMAYPYTTAFGFAGIMTLFNGFSNINEYRIARVETEKAFLRREQGSLALMLEVVHAHTHLADARATLNLAEAAANAAKIELKEETAKMNEGLLRPSEMLNTVAQFDAAQINVVNARYQREVMAAIARNVVGATYCGQKETNNE
ncbi:MAG TPA: TolC family protein [Candidatus Hydrogenedentes bacterium]|nr:TolC family protein [Candidatus Hydrogenedentota bacterium]